MTFNSLIIQTIAVDEPQKYYYNIAQMFFSICQWKHELNHMYYLATINLF
jgi:hypothetical protein